MNTDRHELRPKFHITGGNGWINDPNGLIYFRGKYHVFFQYNPYDTKFGKMHWGHVQSSDLCNWERLPIALAPGGENDRDGCFSGGAVEYNGKLWLMYTGHNENEGGESVRQVQCLASSDDGTVFTKHGVVIGSDGLPEGYAPSDFRDPKLWRHDGKFWCMVAARKIGGKGRVLLYRSDDLFDWTFVSDIFGRDSSGSMIECPDYNDNGLLMLCEQFAPREGSSHLNKHTTRWYAGKLDYETGKFTYAKSGICDYGFDFYAPQTFCGAPVYLAWMNMWERNNPSAKHGFAGMLTSPRKTEIVDGELYQTPYLPLNRIKTEKVDGKLNDSVKIGVIKISADNLSELRLKLRSHGDDCALLTLCGNEWVFDRSRAGEKIVGDETDDDSSAQIRRMPYSNKKHIELTVVLDEFSIEIFENGKVFSSLVYPDACADGVELNVKADVCTYERFDVNAQ